MYDLFTTPFFFFDDVVFLPQTLTLVSGSPLQIPLSICCSAGRPDQAEVRCFWKVNLQPSLFQNFKYNYSTKKFIKYHLLTHPRLSRWIASFIAAWLSLKILQSKQNAAFTETVPVNVKLAGPGAVQHQTIKFAGRTVDLSLFAFTRALDVIVGELWARRRARRVASQQWTRVSFLQPT